MSRTTGVIVLVVVLAIVGAAVWWIGSGAPGTSPLGNAPAPKTYASSQYGFSFQYPGTLSIHELAPEAVVVGSTTPQGFAPVVEVALAQSAKTGASTSSTSYDAYVVSLGHLLCAAQGQNVSVDCPGLDHTNPFTAQTGLQGDALYFQIVRTDLTNHSTATSTFGPVYAFNVGGNVASSSSQFAALLVYEPLGSYLATQDAQDVTAVANTLQVNRTP